MAVKRSGSVATDSTKESRGFQHLHWDGCGHFALQKIDHPGIKAPEVGLDLDGVTLMALENVISPCRLAFDHKRLYLGQRDFSLTFSKVLRHGQQHRCLTNLHQRATLRAKLPPIKPSPNAYPHCHGSEKKNYIVGLTYGLRPKKHAQTYGEGKEGSSQISRQTGWTKKSFVCLHHWRKQEVPPTLGGLLLCWNRVHVAQLNNRRASTEPADRSRPSSWS